MFFRKRDPEDDAGKGKPQKSSGKKKPATKRSTSQAGKGRRRLDSAVPQLRPAPSSRPVAPQRAERGAPLSDETLWLLRQMRQLRDINDYHVLKQPFIARYLANPSHSPGSAERAFYHAVGVCMRRLIQGEL